jgi:hypothetical protein
LERAGCAHAAFVSECLALILSFNFCFFGGSIWRQILGYATGVACGGECAHLYLEERLAPVFARFAMFLLLHLRYIDDGVLVFRGSRAQLDILIAELRAIDPVNLQFTFEVSERSAIFLDSFIFKGDRWQSTGILDYSCYQKAVNRYLYLPFSTETPRHILSGFIRGELIRYLKRSSDELSFVRMQVIFFHRLNEFIVAYRIPKKISGDLVPYRFPPLPPNTNNKGPKSYSSSSSTPPQTQSELSFSGSQLDFTPVDDFELT